MNAALPLGGLNMRLPRMDHFARPTGFAVQTLRPPGSQTDADQVSQRVSAAAAVAEPALRYVGDAANQSASTSSSSFASEAATLVQEFVRLVSTTGLALTAPVLTIGPPQPSGNARTALPYESRTAQLWQTIQTEARRDAVGLSQIAASIRSCKWNLLNQLCDDCLKLPLNVLPCLCRKQSQPLQVIYT